MTDAPTRVAEQRWHGGVPGAAVAVMAVAATLLPGLAVAQDVYVRAGIDLSRPADTHFTDVDCASLVQRKKCWPLYVKAVKQFVGGERASDTSSP